MLRGRPRKNPLPVEEVKIPQAEIEQVKVEEVKIEIVNPMTEIKTLPLPTEEIFSSTKKKKDGDTPTCVCCGAKVYSNRRLNLELLTSLASYHFDVVDTKPYVCGKCAVELGKVINNWLIKNGAEVKPYIKLK